ncbi:methyltransferase domain-containing protein [Saccharopolyspora phatthalungensis]|uniref:Protein-L-isoaspartate O-methyltransferase n=1 Tax=Saccharopolyspora phatthalungensis TaxID=664693 RepID=A0A840QKV3_9PSEU|nr:methyltransferase domain-containing protein [Saccharopolyspora phatthalungensis]MBB5159543.1 methyltransferase of ATP-grasp peptide maturase system [Saccharopolyspora phatthalungensis]
MTTEWKDRAAALADTLIDQDKLFSPEWIAAVRETPRHVLVPQFYEQEPGTGEWREVTSSGDGLQRIYSNTGLFTKIGPDPLWGYTVGLSSTSTPGLMTRMLEALDVHDGHRVLGIGTGTGYNAALLCHRLGEQHVVSVDVEADLVELARGRLAELGYRPTLAAVDGAGGFPDAAPYDRTIATCAVPRVPWAWIDQVRDSGLVLVDVKRAISAGNLVLLRRNGDYAEGRFDSSWGSFMPLRTRDTQHVQPPDRDRTSTKPRTSSIGYLRPWENTVAWFLAALTMPQNVVFGFTPDPDTGQPGDVFLYAPDGSWAEIANQPEDGHFLVWEGGPHRLWSHVEQARTLYKQAGQPGWGRLGLSATPQRQWIWIDDPRGTLTWEI